MTAKRYDALRLWDVSIVVAQHERRNLATINFRTRATDAVRPINSSSSGAVEFARIQRRVSRRRHRARGDVVDFHVPISAHRRDRAKFHPRRGGKRLRDDVTALSLNPAGVAADDRYRRGDGWLLPLDVRGDCHFPTRYVKPLLPGRRVIQTIRRLVYRLGFTREIHPRPTNPRRDRVISKGRGLLEF